MKQLVIILRALGSERRLAILLYLRENKQATVVELADELSVSIPAATRHLQVLARAGCIQRARFGKVVLSNLSDPQHIMVKLSFKILT